MKQVDFFFLGMAVLVCGCGLHPKAGESGSAASCAPVSCSIDPAFPPSLRSNECAPNFRCIPPGSVGAGTCAPACIIDADCSPSGVCKDNAVCIGVDQSSCDARPIKCDPKKASKGKTTECPSDERCIPQPYPGAGFCSPACESEKDCLAGEICTDWQFCIPGF